LKPSKRKIPLQHDHLFSLTLVTRFFASVRIVTGIILIRKSLDYTRYPGSMVHSNLYYGKKPGVDSNAACGTVRPANRDFSLVCRQERNRSANLSADILGYQLDMVLF